MEACVVDLAMSVVGDISSRKNEECVRILEEHFYLNEGKWEDA